MRLVFDATPLIYLGAVDRLSFLRELGAERVVPRQVYSEVVETGLDQGHPDARRVERACEADIVRVIDVPETGHVARLSNNEHLTIADAAVVGHTIDSEGIAVMDDQYGRDVAAAEGVETRGTAWLVLSALGDGTIDPNDARTIIDGMVEERWFCSPRLYAGIIGQVERSSI